MSTCRTCGAPIFWVVVAASNRRMPLDAEQHPDGTVVRLEGDTVRVLTGDEAARRKAQPGGPGPLWVSHFATCPEARQHRRPRRGT